MPRFGALERLDPSEHILERCLDRIETAASFLVKPPDFRGSLVQLLSLALDANPAWCLVASKTSSVPGEPACLCDEVEHDKDDQSDFDSVDGGVVEGNGWRPLGRSHARDQGSASGNREGEEEGVGLSSGRSGFHHVDRL